MMSGWLEAIEFPADAMPLEKCRGRQRYFYTMSTEWPALSSFLTWDHKLTRRRARSRQSHHDGGRPETLCGYVVFRQPNLCRTAVREIAPHGPPLGKLLARLPNAGPFIHDRRSSSHSPTGVRESWRATAVQAATPLRLPCRSNYLIFLRTMPSPVGRTKLGRCGHSFRQLLRG
jgi:ribosomal protein S14